MLKALPECQLSLPSETDEFGSILGASVETSGRKDTNDTKMI